MGDPGQCGGWSYGPSEIAVGRVMRIARGGSLAAPASMTPDLIPAGALAIRQGREGVDGMTVAGLGVLDRFALRLGRLS